MDQNGNCWSGRPPATPTASAGADLPGFFRSMWVGAGDCRHGDLAACLCTEPDVLPVAGPLLGLWLVSPLVAWWLSRPLAAPAVRLSDQQRTFLGKLSRQTWRYFEDFVTAEENWLPPDNFQEHPARVVASRTSPTNIGMALLANLAAYDFGYCSAGRLLDRTQQDVRHAGPDGAPPRPLLQLVRHALAQAAARRATSRRWTAATSPAHLLVLRSGLLELVETNVLPPRVFGGLRDTLRVLLDVARGLHRSEVADRTPLVPATCCARSSDWSRRWSSARPR